MPYSQRLFLVCALLGCHCGFALAQFPVPLVRDNEAARPAQVRELVSQYCRLDYAGTRLDAQGWPRFESLVWWKSDPSYGQIDVISRFAVEEEPTESHGKYSVTVHYSLMGGYDLKAGYAPEPGAVQDVTYTVTHNNGEWKIADADNTSPHVSRAAMLKWLNAKIASTTDASVKAIYEAAVQKLQPPSPTSPH